MTLFRRSLSILAVTALTLSAAVAESFVTPGDRGGDRGDHGPGPGMQPGRPPGGGENHGGPGRPGDNGPRPGDGRPGNGNDHGGPGWGNGPGRPGDGHGGPGRPPERPPERPPVRPEPPRPPYRPEPPPYRPEPPYRPGPRPPVRPNPPGGGYYPPAPGPGYGGDIIVDVQLPYANYQSQLDLTPYIDVRGYYGYRLTAVEITGNSRSQSAMVDVLLNGYAEGRVMLDPYSRTQTIYSRQNLYLGSSFGSLVLAPRGDANIIQVRLILSR